MDPDRNISSLPAELPDWREGLVSPEQKIADSPVLKSGRELQEELANYLRKLATASPDELQVAALRFRAAAEALRAEHELPKPAETAGNIFAQANVGAERKNPTNIGSASVLILGPGAIEFEFHKNISLREVLDQCNEYAKVNFKLRAAYKGELYAKYGNYQFSAGAHAEVRAFDADVMPGTKTQQNDKLWREGMLLCPPELAAAAAVLYSCATGNRILSGYGRTDEIVVIGHSSDGVFSSYSYDNAANDLVGCFGYKSDR